MGILGWLGWGRSGSDIVAEVVETERTLMLTTVAGGGGDGGPAINASLEWPNGVAIDGQGNVFIADTYDSRVRMVDGNGIISTVFQTETLMSSIEMLMSAIDEDQATEASRCWPEAVVVDQWGNLFICNRANNCVYKVDKNGVTTTVCGRGRFGCAGDGGLAFRAKLHKPRAVAIDGEGNLFIADAYNNRVRKVDRDGIITTVAGTGERAFGGDGGPATEASLFWPNGLAVDNEGNLYISDWGNNRIRKVDRNGIITTFAGTGEFDFKGDGGPASEATLRWPLGIAIDLHGNLFITDSFNRRVRMVDTNGVISTVAGVKGGTNQDGVPARDAILVRPYDVATNAAGELFIADTRDYRIRKVDRQGIISTIAGTGRPRHGGDQGPALQATLHRPHDVAVDHHGSLFIADTWNHNIRKVGRDGIISTLTSTKHRTTLTPRDTALPQDGSLRVSTTLFDPVGIAVDGIGNLFVIDKRNNCVYKMNQNGAISVIAGRGMAGFEGDGGPATDALLWWPYAIAIDEEGNLFIADSANNRIRKVDRNGIIDTIAGNGLAGFSGDGGPALKARLTHPCGLAIDSKGNLLIADSWNNCIRRIDPMGIITTVAGTREPGFGGDGGPAEMATLCEPYGVAVGQDGSIWIAERRGNRLRQVTPDGIILSIAEQDVAGYHSDAAPAASAGLNRPCGIAADKEGNLYIADSWNHCIRRITASDA